MLSLTCKVGIKAVLFLASRHSSPEKAGIRDIARFTGSNDHTVGKLLQQLVKAGLVNSMKGPTGGFYLTPDQMKRPIIEIIEVIDGKNVFRECGLGLSKCSATHPCPIHDEYKKAREILQRLFEEKKVYHLCKPVNSGLAHLL